MVISKKPFWKNFTKNLSLYIYIYITFAIKVIYIYIYHHRMAFISPSRLKDYYGWFAENKAILDACMSFSQVKNSRLETAYLLYYHPRNKMVKKESFRGYVLKGEQKRQLNGLTEPLKQIFYPIQKSASTGGAKSGGSSRGNITDREIANLVNNGVFPANLSEGFSVYTERVLAYLHKHELQPFSAQHLVFDETLNIATELDILCIDNKVTAPPNKNIVNIQLKTGFDKNYELKTGYFCSPYVDNSDLENIPTNHKNIHQLQNFAEHIILKRNYDNLVMESVVLVVSESVTSKYRIDRALVALEDDIYENLRLRLEKDPTELEKKI